LLGVAGGALVAGGVFHYLTYDARKDLADADTGAAWDADEGRFDRWRWSTIGAYGVAAIAGGIGAYLWWSDRGEAVRVSGAAGGDGASVLLEWRR
jgi:hypothetical protein